MNPSPFHSIIWKWVLSASCPLTEPSEPGERMDVIVLLKLPNAIPVYGISTLVSTYELTLPVLLSLFIAPGMPYSPRRTSGSLTHHFNLPSPSSCSSMKVLLHLPTWLIPTHLSKSWLLPSLPFTKATIRMVTLCVCVTFGYDSIFGFPENPMHRSLM